MAVSDFYTLEEAKKKGLQYERQNDKTCPYCGKKLEQLGLLAFDERLHWVSIIPCDCQEAVNERIRQQAEEETKKTRDSIKRLKQAGIPKRYLDAMISSNESKLYVQHFADAHGCGLYIVGSVGTGKTHEACALARVFIEEGYSVEVTTSLKMLDSINKSYDDRSLKGLPTFCGVDILVIDDLGKESANAWVLTTLFQIINSRYESALPTIFTSQYELSSLERRLSRGGEKESAEAIASRIFETSTIVQLKGNDRRRQHSKNKKDLENLREPKRSIVASS